MKNKLVICKNTREKGDGYYAKENIPKNTLIFEEKIKVCVNKEKKFPSVLSLWLIYLVYQNKKLKYIFLQSFVPHEINDKSISKERIKMMIKDIEPIKLKKFFDNLDLDEIRLAYEKIKRNCFECDGKIFIAFDGTKFNHSCEANIDYYFNKNTNVLSFYSNKDITSEEELTIQYVNPIIAKSTLYNTYGFNCNCSLCK